MSGFEFGIHAFLVLVSCQGVGLIIMLLHSSQRSIQSKLLITLISAIMAIIVLLFIQHQSFVHFPHLTLLHQPIIFLPLPLFYLFVRSTSEPTFKFKPIHLLHFAIPFLIAINLLPFYFSPGYQKSVAFAMENQLVVISWRWHLFILCVTGWAYLIVSFHTINQRIGSFKNLLLLEDNNKTWISGIALLFTTLLLSATIRLVTNYSIDTELISLGLLSAVVVIVGLKYWFHSSFQGTKYATSNLESTVSKEYLELLINEVTENKLYRNERLTVNDLSNELNIPAYHISQVINQELNVSFWDFINAYRVEEAKKLLHDSRSNPKILRVAYESGFNSRSAFYAAFKKHTGQTPTQFKKTCPDF